MNRKRLSAAIAVAALCGGALYAAERHRTSSSEAAQEKEARGGDQSTSLADQTDLNLTVYNSNIALVRDVRQVSLPSGTFRLKLMDIAATVNPATVHFRSLTDA